MNAERAAKPFAKVSHSAHAGNPPQRPKLPVPRAFDKINQMHSRWFNPLVVLFWLSSMTWLITQKVLPPLIVGEPPSYRSILRQTKAGHGPEISDWRLLWNGRDVGTAQTRIEFRENELTEIVNEVHFDDLPIEEMTPLRMGAFVKSIRGHEKLPLDAESRVAIDPLGQLEQFHSRVDFGGIKEAITVRGYVENRELRMVVRTGDLSYPTKVYLPQNALVGDILSPQNQLPNLRVGQTWTVPIYSPFRMPSAPMDVMQAHVARRETMEWDGKSLTVLVVEYRGDQGAGLKRAKQTMGTVWVNQQGLVLKQEVALLESRLAFVRVPRPAAE